MDKRYGRGELTARQRRLWRHLGTGWFAFAVCAAGIAAVVIARGEPVLGLAWSSLAVGFLTLAILITRQFAGTAAEEPPHQPCAPDEVPP